MRKTEIAMGENLSGLGNSLENAAAIITRNYLDKLERYEILEPSMEDLDIEPAECGRFYRLTKLVINKEENFLHKLTTVVNVAFSIECSLATVIQSDGEKIEYFFGILSKEERGGKAVKVQRREANEAAFKGALFGNLAGSDIEEISGEEMEGLCSKIAGGEDACYASVSGVVSLRDEKEQKVENYVQGLENLADALRGRKYTIVMLADPVKMSELDVVKQGYELLHTQLAAFSRSSVTMSDSDSLSLSKARTDGISEGISQGISMTQSKGTSRGRSFGVSAGVNLSVGIPFVAGAGVNAGVSSGRSSGTSEIWGSQKSRSQSRQTNYSETDTVNTARTTGKSVQITYENRSVKSLLDKIDRHLERLDECESFGAFDCAAYVVAGDRGTALAVAGNYHALMRGEESSVQASHINLWYQSEKTKSLGKYISHFVHPRFWQNKEDRIIVTPASIVSGEEIAIQIGLPKKSVAGLPVVPMTPFGRNVAETHASAVEIGTLYHMGHEEKGNGQKRRVKIDVQSLSMHTFITGSTGSGKSTVVASMLDKLMEQGIHFMVIEPAKGEYKERFGSYGNVDVYGINGKKTPLLRINPFQFPEDIHVLEHIDRLIEIFHVCWPMYAAMPAVLKDAVERAYLAAGWNLETSECRYRNHRGENLFPDFTDVLHQVETVIESSAYSSDSKGDYKGALCTRLRSLTNGLYRQIFTSDEIACEDLFDKNVVIDLSRTGSAETKALLMGLLVMKLQEYRMANAAGGNEPLKHLTVLEEAHHLLKKPSIMSDGEGGSLAGKSVEMLANSIAEMRTYGEGFVVVDQAPGLLDKSVIRNTNTKIILRLPDLEDRELVGRAAGLGEEQILELSRLKTFVAAVYQNNWLEPVLCHVDTNFKDILPYAYTAPPKRDEKKGRILEFLMMPVSKREKLDREFIESLIGDLYRMQLPAQAKVAFLQYLTTRQEQEMRKLRGKVFYHIFNSEEAFAIAKDREEEIDSWRRCMCEVLEPSIRHWSEVDQDRALALLAQERTEHEKAEMAQALYDRFLCRVDAKW